MHTISFSDFLLKATRPVYCHSMIFEKQTIQNRKKIINFTYPQNLSLVGGGG